MFANIQYHSRGLANAISQESKIKNKCWEGRNKIHVIILKYK